MVIIAAELVGLIGMIYMIRCLSLQTSLFDDAVVQVFELQDDTDRIRSLIIKHEDYIDEFLNASAGVNSEVRQKILETEVELRKQIVIHGQIMQKMNPDSERVAIFRNVNDDIIKYLNYNSVLLSMKGTETHESIERFCDSFIHPLIESVNRSIERLGSMSKLYVYDSNQSINSQFGRSRLFCFIAFPLLVVSIIVSIVYSYKVLTNLETDNKTLSLKTVQNEMRIAEIQEKTIMGIADLVENRSGETGQHVKRTSHLVNKILLQAQKHGLWPEVLTSSYIDYVTRAAPMHDIGKIVISDTILNKPGKLTEEEFEIMKTHAATGGRLVYELLSGVEDEEYVNIASAIASYHHEKWNGRGYPNGIKGNDIPLCARIMAVADVFDALVSERCYKKPMKREDAFALIQREAGEHFDPAIVDLFLEMKDEIYENC